MKVGIPKGMRDFSPIEMARRNYIFDTIRKHFQLFGYEQIETPTMENRETLTGKYGEEGDRLIFNVLNSGDFLKKTNPADLSEANLARLLPQMAEKALRYDLTVPFARYVVQHQNDIAFPFKRFQIQPVWRADRPQKGRYREFYQCDADVIGSDSLLSEVELIQLFDGVLSELGLKDFSIKINNRKVLSGIAEVIGRPEKIVDITVAIDKLDKIGQDKVMEEMAQKGLSEKEIDLIKPLLDLNGDNYLVINKLIDYLKVSKIGQEGLDELQTVLDFLKAVKLKKAKIELDVTLARGLDYYTGAIFEVASNEVQIGSICGGGRYADLTGIFGLKGMSGVGISFGADRIYDVMEELKLFPEKLAQSTELMIINFGEKEALHALGIIEKLREEGISAELYPDATKMAKQMKYADRKQIPHVLLVGEQEIQSGQYSLKNMQSGEQSQLDLGGLIKKLKA